MEMANNQNLYLEVLNVAQRISDFGPTIVDSLRTTEKRRLYSLIVEAFRSFSAFSRLIKGHFLVQGSAVLRVLTEQTLKNNLLVEYPELYALTA